MAEVLTFAKAGALSTAGLLLLRLALPDSLQTMRVPLSVLLIDAALAGAGIVGVRVLRRAAFESERHARRHRAQSGPRRAVLLIGAGHAGVMAVNELHGRGDCHLEVKGFLDDDPVRRNAVIAGIPVIGSTDDLPRLVPELGIDHVIITIADAKAEQLRRILAVCRSIPVHAQITPGFHDVIQGRVKISHFRDVRPEELLERDPVRLDHSNVARFVGGKVVMVTGAGGSIGSELARQIARFAPAKLLLVERSEPALFEIDRELRGLWPNLELLPLIGDVGDAGRMRTILKAHHPQVITHAAAHKHVPLMESNAAEAIKNNVFGTLTLGELAGQCGVEAFVMISTDKAVRPSSVMGASKRVAELVVQDLGRRYPTRYVAVRFGNVLGSAGSVIPIFREQIARGGPVTITHPDMKRYFMTIPEAALLVLEAGAMGQGGEIFVLDMGQPVRVLDMAKRLIELAGHGPEQEIEIVFTGLRPGEKLFEELETSDEAIAKTRHPKVFIGKIQGRSPVELHALLTELRAVCSNGVTPATLRARLARFLPDSQLAAVPAQAGEDSGAYPAALALAAASAAVPRLVPAES